MGSAHTPADDIVYDLISIQYHALKAAQVYDKYAQDARRAERCHELLYHLTKDRGIG